MAEEGAASRTLPVSRAGAAGEDAVAVEEPLELRVEGLPAAVTMRTPGADLDLAVGFLLGEGVIDGIDDVRAVAQVSANVVDVRLAEGVPAARARSADRALFRSSSCGICGVAALDRLPRPRGPVAAFAPSPAAVAAAVAALSAAMHTFRETGGVHGAALFDATGALLLVREDIGRHNAVDKVLGARLRADGEAAGLGLVVSSRAGFEIVQKAIAAGCGCVVAFGAATTLAVEAARRAGLGLVGWAGRAPVTYAEPGGPAGGQGPE